jgi:thiol-disulfide isomerase/thioredoxin
VIRRLREITEQLAQVSAGAASMSSPAVGTRIGEFAAVTVAGDAAALRTGAEESIVAFFSPGCGPCAALLPAFVEYAADSDTPVLAVIVGDGDEVPEMVAKLAAVADVVRESGGGSVSTTFGIAAFPALIVLDADRTVRASGHDLTAVRRVATVG